MVGNSAIVMLVSFKKRMGAVTTVEMEPQGGRDLTVSCDETKHETTSSEEDHSPIASARSNDWAECRDKKSVGTESTERNIS